MPGKTKRKRRHGGRRSSPSTIALVVALGVLGLLVLVAAGASLALHRILTTGTLRGWVNDKPEKLRLEYASASGWFPWDVRVRGLELRARDPNVEWYFRMDEARLAFSPIELLSRRLHMTRVRGRGLAFRLRVRVRSAEASAEHFAALPPIPGFPERPLKDAGPEEPPSGHPLEIAVGDLRVEEVREVWLDIWRLGGPGAKGTLAGSFDLFPHHHATVGRTTLALSGGSLSIARHTILRPFEFSTEGSISTFNPQTVRGNEVWPYISGGLRLSGPLAGFDFMNYFLRNAPEPRIDRGAGSFRAELAIDRGRGSGSVTADARAIRARYHDANITSDAAVRARIPEWDFRRDRVNLSGTRVDLIHVAAGEPGPDSRDWWGRFDLKKADIVGGRPAAFHSEVALRCRDARPLFTLFDTALPGWARGVLKLEGLDAHGSVGLGKGHVDVDGLDARGGAFRILGRYRVRGREKDGAFLLDSGALALGLEIEKGRSKLKLAGAREWFAETAADKPASASRK